MKKHPLTGRKRSAKSLAKFKATMAAKRAAKRATNGAGEDTREGHHSFIPMDALPELPAPLKTNRRPPVQVVRATGRGIMLQPIDLDIKPGSQFSLSLGGFRLTVRTEK